MESVLKYSGYQRRKAWFSFATQGHVRNEHKSHYTLIRHVMQHFLFYILRRIRKYLSRESAEILVHALVMGRMDYCNSLLLRVPYIHLNKLQRVQNTMARLVCIVPRFCHIAPVLGSLHWLPVKLELISKF